MGYIESDDEFERWLKEVAAAEIPVENPNVNDEQAALRRFRHRLRAYQVSERRAAVTRHVTALCDFPRRHSLPVGGPRLALLGVVVLLIVGVGAVLSIASPNDGHGGNPNDRALDHRRSPSGEGASAQPPTEPRRMVINTSLSGKVASNSQGVSQTTIPSPGTPSAKSSSKVTDTPAPGTWVVKGKNITLKQEIQLETKAKHLKLTAMVSAHNTLFPCQWSVGMPHSEKKPSTTDPTKVTFYVNKPTKVVTLGVKHTPSGENTETVECVMTKITVEGEPASSRHASPTPSTTDPRVRNEPTFQRGTTPTSTTTTATPTATPTSVQPGPTTQPAPPNPSVTTPGGTP